MRPNIDDGDDEGDFEKRLLRRPRRRSSNCSSRCLRAARPTGPGVHWRKRWRRSRKRRNWRKGPPRFGFGSEDVGGCCVDAVNGGSDAAADRVNDLLASTNGDCDVAADDDGGGCGDYDAGEWENRRRPRLPIVKASSAALKVLPAPLPPPPTLPPPPPIQPDSIAATSPSRPAPSPEVVGCSMRPEWKKLKMRMKTSLKSQSRIRWELYSFLVAVVVDPFSFEADIYIRDVPFCVSVSVFRPPFETAFSPPL